jgi:hypothetical protein
VKFEIGNNLETQEPFYLDIANVITGRTFIASITRWGKSWTARKIIEECFGHAGIIVIDPEGEYISLREKYPFLIIGKDIPLQLETAEFMADKILESKISVIIDLSKIEDEYGKEYVEKLLHRFFFLETTIRTPYLIIVEEAEDFGPEKGIATATCVDILRNITKKGGKRGIGILMIAHRPAWVSKGILSQCANKAIGRIDWPGDLNVLEEYTRIPRATTDRLPNLGKGEFCFTGDWVEKTVFVKVGQVKTTHLGFTPDVVPPSPKELQGVLASLRKAIPEVIEKIKPTVVPIEKIKSDLKVELEHKYKDRIESIQRTAEEKAERKFRAKIDELQDHIEELSRSQALQPTSPISDVLEHPIVKTRMLELPAKDRDMLIKIEKEPGLTREQLAAFLTTSTNGVASMVKRINRVFKATAIIGEGKPMKYKSLLKRLFITDVAKREIEEMERLQRNLREKTEKMQGLEQRVEILRTDVGYLRPELERVSSMLKKNEEKLGKTTFENQKLTQEIKELKLTAKVGEPLLLAIEAVVEDRINKLKQTVPNTVAPIQPIIDQKKVYDIVDQRFNENMAKSPSSTTSTIATSVSLDHKVSHFDFNKTEEDLKVDTTTLTGRIVFLVTKGFFDARQNRKKVVIELSNNGWNHADKEVDDALLELCQKGIFYRKISTGNVFWYSLQSEAKEKIHS